ncbi:MAG: class I SAM-dependent methyltransferase [Marmoricola sp.]
MSSPCPVCEQPTQPWGTGTVLGDVRADYVRCQACGLIRAEHPDWLERAYSSAIADLDIGLLDRCLVLSHVTAAVLFAQRLRGGSFLDWAGGYGTLTRLMRDRGHDFVDHDPMATNVFAGRHRVDDLTGLRFDAVTAFEVLEHLADPVEQLREAAELTDLLLVTTQVIPDPAPRPGSWDYYAPETGQHITFYTARTVAVLARRLGFHGSVSGSLVHLMHRRPIMRRTRALVRSHRLAYGVGLVASLPDRRRSLLLADAERVRSGS